MPSSGRKKRPHKGYRGDLRFVKNKTESSKPKASKASRRSGAAGAGRTRSSRPTSDAPVTAQWDDLLAGNAARRASLKTPEGRLATMSTARVALFIIAIASLFTLYVGHIYATQDLLADVQRLRTENLELYLERNRLSSAWDMKTAPPVIYERARELGLSESVPEGEPVILP